MAWLWYYAGQKREAIKNWALVLLPLIALTVPWSIRNPLLYGELVFVESSLGFNYHLGHQPEGTGTFDSPVAVELLELIGAFEQPSLETEKTAYNLGMEKSLRFISEGDRVINLRERLSGGQEGPQQDGLGGHEAGARIRQGAEGAILDREEVWRSQARTWARAVPVHRLAEVCHPGLHDGSDTELEEDGKAADRGELQGQSESGCLILGERCVR